MAYGTPEEVAALARLWTQDGEWVDPDDYAEERGTNPTLTTVNLWLDQLSSQMDLCLQTNWFVVPVDPDDSPTAHAAIAQYIVELAAGLARSANGQEGGVSTGRQAKDMCAWVASNADGFVKDGVQQVEQTDKKTQIKFRVIGTL